MSGRPPLVPPETGASGWGSPDDGGAPGWTNTPEYIVSKGGVPPFSPEEGSAPWEPPPRRRGRALPWAIAAFLLAGALIFARYYVFSVRDLRVSGIRYVPLDMVRKTLGLEKNRFYFTLTEEYVKRAVNANRYLQFVSMEKIPPNALLLEVRERWPLAFFTHLGMGYVLSQDATVLEQSRDLSKGSTLIAVYGLQAWGQVVPGAYPQTSDLDQVPRLKAVFAALLEWGFDSQVQSVDVGQSMALSLMTYDGYLVNLGNVSFISAKIGTAQAVITELRRMGAPGGILECAKPGEASFRASQP